MTPTVKIFTDGSCRRNPGGPGGWAVLLRTGKIQKLITGGSKSTTAHRMEMMAVIRGLESIKTPSLVVIYTDCKYITDAFKKGWIKNWVKHGNLREGGKANWDLWIRLLEAMEKHKVFWIWVKAHNGHPENEIVDGEAKKASRRYYADTSDQRRIVPNHWA